MREEKLKKVKAIEKDEADLISDLPDVLVACIISLLPGMEIVRTSVLSHRWKTMWKYSSHLSFDQKQMLKSWIEFYIQNSNSSSRIAMAMRRKIDPKAEELMDTISEAAILIKSIMENHIGPLKSCSIQHLPESCASGDAVEWMKKLLNLGVIKVSMELELRYYLHEITDSDLRKAGRTLDLPFEIFSNFEIIELKNYHFTTIPFPNPSQVLKTLILNNVRIISNNFQGILSHCSSLEDLILDQCKFFEDELKIDSPSLKYVKMYNLNIRKILVFAANVEVIEIDSVICNHKDLVLQPPKLSVLRAYNDVNSFGRGFYQNGNKLLTSTNIIEICGGLLRRHRGSITGSIFDNLITLSLDLALTNIRCMVAISSALESCHKLKNLQINNQVNSDYNDDTHDYNKNNFLPYPGVLFWQRRDPSQCTSHQLKSLCIKGYRSGEFEVEFVKHFILNGGVIEKIIIWFVDHCSWDQVVATKCLLSFPKLSPKLFIDLKPGPEFMRKDGGDFEKWLKSLI